MKLKRRAKKKTDYAQRLGLLKSGKPRIVVRRHNRNIRIQVVEYGKAGDATLVDVSSSSLKKYGWLGHGGSLPSAYLAGMLAGFAARKKGISEGILDIGLQRSSKSSSIYAAAKGVKDAGLGINVGSEALPDESRISGKHISDYAEKMDSQKYERHFSACIKNNFNPKDIQKHFEDAKNRIISEFR